MEKLWEFLKWLCIMDLTQKIRENNLGKAFLIKY